MIGFGTITNTAAIIAAGEWLDIEGAFVRLGEWLKRKTGNARDASFVHAFVTATLTVCLGAMGIVGALP